MQYKTELHAHTRESSSCADFYAQEVAEQYIAAGYTTVFVTNHYNDYNLELGGDTWDAQISHHLEGYRAMKAYAGDRLCVLLGCELRFVGSANDYLVFGMDEEFLLNHPELHKMNLKSFCALAHLHGFLIIQAHPFRNGMTVMNPDLLDGYEIYNGHPGHHSRNQIANAWATQFGKIRTSGTDFHHPTQSPCGGILTSAPIRTQEELLDTLKSGDYTLLCSGAAAERDGMRDMPANA